MESSYIQYLDVNNFYGRKMLQKLSVNNFEWIKDTSQFNEDFIKTIMKKLMKDNFWKLIINTLNFVMIYHFLPGRIKIEKSKILQLVYLIKLNMLFT